MVPRQGVAASRLAKAAADCRGCIASAAVSQGLDIDDQAVLKPDPLHQLVGSEIVRPHFHLDFNGWGRYQI
jgi:hypothetical protein